MCAYSELDCVCVCVFVILTVCACETGECVCLCSLSFSLVLPLSNTDFTLSLLLRPSTPPHTHTDISLASVSVCSVMRQRLGLANTSACHVTVCPPATVYRWLWYGNPSRRTWKALKEGRRERESWEDSRKHKREKEEKKVLNLCLPFTAAGQGGRECRIKGDRGEKTTMQASNCVTLRLYQVLTWLKSSH